MQYKLAETCDQVLFSFRRVNKIWKRKRTAVRAALKFCADRRLTQSYVVIETIALALLLEGHSGVHIEATFIVHE